MRPSWHWAWIKTWERLLGRPGYVLVPVFGLIGLAVGLLLIPPRGIVVGGHLVATPDNFTDALLRAAIGVFVALIGLLLLVFVGSFVGAPFEQRNVLRRIASEHLAHGIYFGRTALRNQERLDVPSPGSTVTEEVWVVEVRSKGGKTIENVEVVLQAVHPEIPAIHHENLVAWQNFRSETPKTTIPPGKSVWFGVTQQDWVRGSDPERWYLMRVGAMNPPMPFERHEIELSAYGDDVAPAHARFAIEMKAHNKIELHRLDDS